MGRALYQRGGRFGNYLFFRIDVYKRQPLGRYEKYPIKDAALLMTSADDFFWTYEQAVSYYKFAIINYLGFNDKGMLLAGGCGDTNGKPQIDKTNHLEEAYKFGINIYNE